jgi:hypothetical protein
MGPIGFSFVKSDGSPAATADVQQIEQTLDPWNGEIKGRFQIEA